MCGHVPHPDLMGSRTSQGSIQRRKPTSRRPSHHRDPPLRPAPKRQRTSLYVSTSSLSTDDHALETHPEPTTPPAACLSTLSLVDTPLHPSSSSSARSRPEQLQHSSRSQTMAATLAPSIADEAQQRNSALARTAIHREEMERKLCREIGGAVYQYQPFCSEFFTIDDRARRDDIEQTLLAEPLFRYDDQDWSVDCSDLEGQESAAMHQTIAKILDTINQAAFAADSHRPVLKDILPLLETRLDADDADDSNTSPDVVQAGMNTEGRRQWAEVDFFAECKSSTKQLGEALMQLARYARATLVHQIHRLHVFAIAICGAEASFVRLGRTGILHSPPISLRTHFKQFVLAAGLFALDSHAFGYDTRFYFWLPLTANQQDHTIPREMRVRTENKRWKVLEILCQRKCLVGRATLVLRLCRVKDHRERVVLKSIWRDESRKDEGDNVESFEDCHGICKCLWPKQCESTSVANKASLVPSPYMSSFPPPPLSEATVAHLHSETSGTSSQRLRSLAAKQGAARRDQRRCTPPEDRVRSLILMDEGIPLWRVKRLVHLLKVLRDALVGLAGIVRRGRVHRDISEGNILCDPIDHSIEPDADPSSGIDPKPFINLRSLSTQKTPIDPESEPVLMPNADTRSDSDSESTLVDSDESEDETLVGDDDESEALFGSHLPFEGGKIRSTTYEEYTQKRYKTFGCIGRLYDLEFMVEENRDNNMARHQNRTGTPAFIAAQLLLATNDKPIRHTFLHDLESFFWVLVWALATHVQPGKRMNKDALRLIDSLCSDNDWALGNFKRGFILTPRTTRQAIKELGNGWEDGRRVVQKFAESLKTHIYDKEGGPGGSDDDVEADAASEQEPWLIVKTVIDIFDEQILGLQELGE